MMCHSDSISTCYRPYLKYSRYRLQYFWAWNTQSSNWKPLHNLHSNILVFFLLMVCLNQLNIIPAKLVGSLRLLFLLFGRLQYFFRSHTKFGLMLVKETTQQRWLFTWTTLMKKKPCSNYLKTLRAFPEIRDLKQCFELFSIQQLIRITETRLKRLLSPKGWNLMNVCPSCCLLKV